jgi:putative endonuclease
MAKQGERRWTVYILRCGDGSLYTGITDRLAERLARHGAGKGARYTRSRLPVALVWSRGRQTATEARRLEDALKRRPRGDKVRLVAGDDRVWRRLRRALVVKGPGRAPRPSASRGRPSRAGRARG